MTEALLSYFRSTLPDELAASLTAQLDRLEKGDFLAIFKHPLVQVLLGHEEDGETKRIQLEDFPLWSDYIFRRLGVLLGKRQDGGLDVSAMSIFLSP